MSKRLKHLLKKCDELVREGEQNLKKVAAAFPEEFFMELTYACPQKCIMCDVWPRYLKEPALRDEELTLSEIKALINNSRYLQKIKTVVLTGGEPFLRSDLAEICGLFLEKYPHLSLGILTSSFDPQIILKKLAEIHRRYHPSNLWLGSSLDGLKNNHDRIRGVKGSFDRVMETLSLAQEEFPSQRWGINFIILPSNYNDLLPVFELCRERKLEFSAQFPVHWKNTPQFKWKENTLNEVEDTIKQILEWKVNLHPDTNSAQRPLGDREVELLADLFYWQNLVSYQRDPRRILPWCPAGRRYIMLNPQGGLYFCPQLKYAVLGNTKNESLDGVWTSPGASQLREKIQSGKCHCWLNCSVYSFARAALRSLK